MIWFGDEKNVWPQRWEFYLTINKNRTLIWGNDVWLAYMYWDMIWVKRVKRETSVIYSKMGIIINRLKLHGLLDVWMETA